MINVQDTRYLKISLLNLSNPTVIHQIKFVYDIIKNQKLCLTAYGNFYQPPVTTDPTCGPLNYMAKKYYLGNYGNSLYSSI